jgi:hypothetical protein
MAESTWSIGLPEFDEDGDLYRREDWTGPKTAIPDLATLSRITYEISEQDLTDIAIQIIQQAPPGNISHLLSTLCCAYCRKGNKSASATTIPLIDLRTLTQLGATAKKSQCGRVFRKGDIVWQCRNCGKDTACVQCDPCFRKSNHIGHEVYFHRAAGGSGCCDCGDSEAWLKQGNCCDHSPPNENASPTGLDPVASLPIPLKKGFRAVAEAVVTSFGTYMCAVMRGFVSIESNQFLHLAKEFLPTETFTLSIHNDDIHSYDEVIHVFTAIGLNPNAASALTRKIDVEGGAVLVKGEVSSSLMLHDSFEFLKMHHLIASIVPDWLAFMEASMSQAIKWLNTMSENSEGFRRLISLELIQSIGSRKSHNTPLNLEVDEYERFQLKQMSAENIQFPNEIVQLHEIETLDLKLSTSISSNPLSKQRSDYELKSRIRFPFMYLEKSVLSYMILSSSFLSISLQKLINDMVIRYQYDPIFKAAFAQAFTVLYPTSLMLFLKGHGTKQYSIFHNSVQMYTSNTVIETMSSDSKLSRTFLEPNGQLYITNMLLSTLFASYKFNKLMASNSSQLFDCRAFVLESSLRTRRYAQACRDLEYICTSPVFCARMMSNDVNPGTVSCFFLCVFLCFV